MKFLMFFAGLLLSANALAFPQDTLCQDRYPNLCQGTTTYQCSGARVSGTVKITALDRVTAKPGGVGIAYKVSSKLLVDGRPYSLKGQSEVKYRRHYVDGYGSWVPNYDVWLYNLLAARAAFNPNHVPIYLEVAYGGSGGIHGSLEFQDSYAPVDPSFNFDCQIQ